MSYSLSGYSAMIDDGVRTDAHLAALARTITPACVVVDLGAGSGFFTFEALRMGARHVHAIEPSEALVVAERVARQSGLAGRITFHRAFSTAVTLDERADVVVADMRGTLPLLGSNVPAIADARARLLKPDGALVPARDVVSCALVEGDEAYARWLRVFGTREGALDVSPARALLVNRLMTGTLDETRALSSSGTLFVVDYARDHTTRFSGQTELVVERSATAHALHVWFDATLVEGISYTTGRADDGRRATVYGTVYFPLARPLVLSEGDRVRVSVRADLVDDDVVWTWETRASPSGGAPVTFRQSTFEGRILVMDTLVKQSPAYVPRASVEGEIERDILGLIDGVRTQGDIAHALRARHPDRFVDEKSALARVAKVARRLES